MVAKTECRRLDGLNNKHLFLIGLSKEVKSEKPLRFEGLVARGTKHGIRGFRMGRGAGDWVQSPVASELINHAYLIKPS